MNIPLHEAVRPRGNRDDAGVNGEALHQLADWLEANCSEQSVPEHGTRLQLWEVLQNNWDKIPLAHHQALELMKEWSEKAPAESV